MRIDLTSLIVGLGVATILWWVIARSRPLWRDLRGTVRERRPSGQEIRITPAIPLLLTRPMPSSQSMGSTARFRKSHLGLKLGKPVIGLKTAWEIPGIVPVNSPGEAIEKVAAHLKRSK